MIQVRIPTRALCAISFGCVMMISLAACGSSNKAAASPTPTPGWKTATALTGQGAAPKAATTTTVSKANEAKIEAFCAISKRVDSLSAAFEASTKSAEATKSYFQTLQSIAEERATKAPDAIRTEAKVVASVARKMNDAAKAKGYDLIKLSASPAFQALMNGDYESATTEAMDADTSWANENC